MFIWILILGPWIALLVLTLHDVTKNDDEGSAILIGANNTVTLVRWATLNAGGVRKALGLWFSQAIVLKPPANLRTAVEINSSSSASIRHDGENTPAAVPPKKWWSKDGRVLKDGRVSKTAEELELMITEAVKAAPDCEAFVGVVVQRITRKSRLDANWELRGTKFGRADRKIAREALTPIVERIQREFRLPEGPI
jgi:hypothetical protein